MLHHSIQAFLNVKLPPISKTLERKEQKNLLELLFQREGVLSSQMVVFHSFRLATLTEFISIASYIFESQVLNLKNLLA